MNIRAKQRIERLHPSAVSVRSAAVLGAFVIVLTALPLGQMANGTRAEAFDRAQRDAGVVFGVVQREMAALKDLDAGVAIPVGAALSAGPSGEADARTSLDAYASVNGVLLGLVTKAGAHVADPAALGRGAVDATALPKLSTGGGVWVMPLAGPEPWIVATRALPNGGGLVVAGRPLDENFAVRALALTTDPGARVHFVRTAPGSPEPPSHSAGDSAVAVTSVGGGYAAAVTVPVHAAAVKTVLTAIAPLLLFLAAGGTFLLIIRRTLQRPLQRLDYAIAELARDNFSAAIPTEGTTEIRRLGQSFSTMRDQMRAVIDSVEARAAVALELNAAQPLQTALESVCIHLCGTTGASRALIFVNAPDLADPYCVVAGGEEIENPAALLLSDGPVGEAARSVERAPLLACATPLSLESGVGIRSVCAAPLRMGARHLGVLVLADRPDGFRPSDIGLIESSAEQIALALERYRFLSVVQHQASTDELTGLHNYRFLVDYLDQQQALAERQESPLAVLMLDIDHFKQLNDRHGHHAGDAALQTFAHTLTQCIRRSDLAARYGGEEFAVVMSNTGRADAVLVAEKIRAAVEAAIVPIGEGLRMTVSIGAVAYPDDTRNCQKLLRLADGALYRAKEGGRNRVCVSETQGPVLRASRRRPRRQREIHREAG